MFGGVVKQGLVSFPADVKLRLSFMVHNLALRLCLGFHFLEEFLVPFLTLARQFFLKLDFVWCEQGRHVNVRHPRVGDRVGMVFRIWPGRVVESDFLPAVLQHP